MRNPDHIPVETLNALIEQSELTDTILTPVFSTPRVGARWAGRLSSPHPMADINISYIDSDMFSAGLQELVTDDY